MWDKNDEESGGILATENEAICGTPNVFRRRIVAPQPEITIQPAQVKALGNVIVACERRRGYRQGSRRRAVLRSWLSQQPFWLILVMQSEIGSEFERAQGQPNACRVFDDLGEYASLAQAEASDGQFYCFHEPTDRRSREAGVGKQRQTSLVDPNARHL